MNEPRPRRTGVAPLALLILGAGCDHRPEIPATLPPPPPVVTAASAAPDLDAVIAHATERGQPLLVLVAELHKDVANDLAWESYGWALLGDAAHRIQTVKLDLGISRNRATAARFHALETPVLLTLSPRGLIVSRDEASITEELLARRIDEIGPRSAELDAKLAALMEPTTRDPTDIKARLALADFLQSRQNLREAIPHLASVARSDAVDPALRIRAWVDLARAHQWIAEPEKGRHEAQTLMAEWGPKFPEARAGASLVLALQDARANRPARARQEFEDAIAAAPDSAYAQQARAELAKLPQGEK